MERKNKTGPKANKQLHVSGSPNGKNSDTTLENVVGLVFVHVQSGSADASVFQSLGQCRLVHQAATGRVDQESPRPHLLDRVLVDQVVIVLVEGAVKGDAVRLEEQILLHSLFIINFVFFFFYEWDIQLCGLA